VKEFGDLKKLGSRLRGGKEGVPKKINKLRIEVHFITR
jgi:hypothetical protein